jgi:hypothetical protein
MSLPLAWWMPLSKRDRFRSREKGWFGGNPAHGVRRNRLGEWTQQTSPFSSARSICEKAMRSLPGDGNLSEVPKAQRLYKN